MRIKRVALVSLITFLVGGVGGAAYAYVSHPAFHSEEGDFSLAINLEQIQENHEVEQFITQQEQLRPDGLEESKIETGSKYTGITYNHVSPATVKKNDDETDPALAAAEADPPTVDGEKKSVLDWLFGQKDSDGDQQNVTTQTTQQGRISIQKGSLNVRAQGNMNGGVIGQVYKDDVVEVLQQEGTWYRIKTVDGLEGYVSASYITLLE